MADLTNAQRSKDWRKKNPEKSRESDRKSKSKHYEKHLRRLRNYDLRRRYGITLEDYERMVKEQNNSCAICGAEGGEGRKRLIVDHHHVTGKIRQLLCQPCNAVLGMCFENTSTLQSAIQYLNRHNEVEDEKR